MTPNETILDAWDRAPVNWPGCREGIPYRLVAREPLPALANLLPDEPAEPVACYPVEFSWQRGRIDGQPVWRVIGKWRDTEITVAHGLNA